MKQNIEFVSINKKRLCFDNTEAFQFRKDRPAHLLQKICISVLRKLRAFYVDDKITFERHTIDSEKFIDKLLKQRHELICFFNREPRTLLIGAEDYAELMHEISATQTFSFVTEYIYGLEVYGLTVKVTPWMRGILVMPGIE